MLRKLLPCIGKYKKETILTPIMVILEVLLEVFIPFLMAKIIDIGVKGDGGIPFILKYGSLMLLMAALSLVFGALSGRFGAVASTGFAKNVRSALFSKIQDFSFANVDKFSTASLVTRLTTDVTFLQNSFMMIIRMLVRAPVMLISATALALSINRELAVIFLIAIPVLAVMLVFVSVKAHPLFRKMFGKYDDMNASVQENLVGIRVVKAYVRGEYESEKFNRAAMELQEAQKKAERIIIFNMPFMQITMYTCIIAILWFGGKLIVGGDMLTGELISFISYVTQILMSLMMVSFGFVSIVMSRASVVRIVEVLSEEVDIKNSATDDFEVESGAIEFSDVSFSYSKDTENLALENINLKIESGETIGIIGGTGSGKTSVVQLIPRLYDVTGGCVLVDGRDVRDYKIENLRKSVAMVLQNNVLFSGTILENIKWGNDEASFEDVERACRAAQAHEFIMSFPKGYDTYLGQGGVNVSGGQKQRLCIARALLASPRILILDDSTSAIDTATEAKIRQAFRNELPETTKIIIAQRITSVSDADKIVVLDDGKIEDVGTHEELLRNNVIYREIYESQQREVG